MNEFKFKSKEEGIEFLEGSECQVYDLPNPSLSDYAVMVVPCGCSGHDTLTEPCAILWNNGYLQLHDSVREQCEYLRHKLQQYTNSQQPPKGKDMKMSSRGVGD